jgi:hypothetical protein
VKYLIAALCLLAAPAHAQKGHDPGARPHKGVLLQAGAGAGYSRRNHDWGLSLPSLTIGLYVRRNVILGVHFTGASHLQGLMGSHPYAFMLGFYGPMMQYWWKDQIYLGVGCGLYYYSQRNQFAKNSWSDTIGGLGIALKIGVTAYKWEGGRINVFSELMPALFPRDIQVSAIAGAEWQTP